MSKKLQWAISGLALLIVGFVALQIYLYVDMQRFKKKPAGPVPKMETETQQPPEQVQVPEVDNSPAPPDDGREYVWHGDHWDSVDSQHAPTPQTPPVVEKETTYHGPLTYHADLLETHPVKALKLQTEERVHWCAVYIPLLPPDDEEAQAYAKTEYLKHYYQSIGDIDNPIYKKAMMDKSSMLRVFMSYPYNGRTMDLMRLTWPSLLQKMKVGHASEYFGIK